MNSLSSQNILLIEVHEAQTEKQLEIKRFFREIRKSGKYWFDVPNYGNIIQTLSVISWENFLDKWVWWELATYWYTYSKMWKQEEIGSYGLFKDLALREMYTNQQEMLAMMQYLKSCGENPGDLDRVIEASVFICRYQNFRAYDHAYVFKKMPSELVGNDALIHHMPLDGRLKLWRSVVFNASRGRKKVLVKERSCPHCHHIH